MLGPRDDEYQDDQFGEPRRVAPAGAAPFASSEPAPPPPPPPPGPSAPFQREQFRDAWMSTGSDAGRQNQLLSQHNLTPDGAGRVTLPTGEVIDLRLGARAGGTQATWTGVAGGTQKTGQPGIGGSVSGLARSGAPQASGFQDQIRQLLLSQLQGLSKPVSAQDPEISGEMQAQERILERLRQDRRGAAAERAAANGLLQGGQSSGAFDADVASGYEDKGNALTGLQAQLFTRAIQGRRQQVAQLLNMALQSNDAEAARALQLQLGQMDNELRRMGISEQARQFDDSFGLNAAQFQYGKDRDAFLYGSGF